MQILEPTGESKDLIRRFPWDVWLEHDGKPRVIDQTIDFPQTDIKNMQIYLYQQAQKRDLKVVTRLAEGRYVVYQVYVEDEEDAPVLPNFKPSAEKPKCRHCGKVLDKYSVPFGEHRKPNRPNQRSCK